MSQDNWIRCCEFFQVDPIKTDANQKISLQRLRRGLMLHQAYVIFVQLQQERTVAGGGFNGDAMGLGKTVTAIGYCVVEHILHLAHSSVNSARMKGRTDLYLLQAHQQIHRLRI